MTFPICTQGSSPLPREPPTLLDTTSYDRYSRVERTSSRQNYITSTKEYDMQTVHNVTVLKNFLDVCPSIHVAEVDPLLRASVGVYQVVVCLSISSSSKEVLVIVGQTLHSSLVSLASFLSIQGSQHG